MWHTFVTAFRAGLQGASKDQWRNGYPATKTSDAMRAVKATVNGKLSVLRVRLKHGNPLVLEELRQKSQT